VCISSTVDVYKSLLEDFDAKECGIIMMGAALSSDYKRSGPIEHGWQRQLHDIRTGSRVVGFSVDSSLGEFKLAAVRRLEQELSIADAARALEVSPNVLHHWRREFRQGPGVPELVCALCSTASTWTALRIST
jgi:hypothetical protein